MPNPTPVAQATGKIPPHQPLPKGEAPVAPKGPQEASVAPRPASDFMPPQLPIHSLLDEMTGARNRSCLFALGPLEQFRCREQLRQSAMRLTDAAATGESPLATDGALGTFTSPIRGVTILFFPGWMTSPVPAVKVVELRW